MSSVFRKFFVLFKIVAKLGIAFIVPDPYFIVKPTTFAVGFKKTFIGNYIYVRLFRRFLFLFGRDSLFHERDCVNLYELFVFFKLVKLCALVDKYLGVLNGSARLYA